MRVPLKALTGSTGNPKLVGKPFSPKPQSLRFRELLSRATTDPAWARSVCTAVSGAEHSLLHDHASELTAALARLFTASEPSVDLFALVTHVLAVRSLARPP